MPPAGFAWLPPHGLTVARRCEGTPAYKTSDRSSHGLAAARRCEGTPEHKTSDRSSHGLAAAPR
eukprot:948775-Prorocentrum_minimum.AAC.1